MVSFFAAVSALDLHERAIVPVYKFTFVGVAQDFRVDDLIMNETATALKTPLLIRAANNFLRIRAASANTHVFIRVAGHKSLGNYFSKCGF